jgi:hypothetical protein
MVGPTCRRGICSTARACPRHRSELKWIEQGVISNKILDFDGSNAKKKLKEGVPKVI